MNDADQNRNEPPAEDATPECPRCGCSHMSFVSRQGRFGRTVIERYACRNCGKVNGFTAKKSGEA